MRLHVRRPAALVLALGLLAASLVLLPSLPTAAATHGAIHTYDELSDGSRVGGAYPGFVYSGGDVVSCAAPPNPPTTPPCLVSPGTSAVEIVSSAPFNRFAFDPTGYVRVEGFDAAGRSVMTLECSGQLVGGLCAAEGHAMVRVRITLVDGPRYTFDTASFTFSHACNDGADNDGDGVRDYPFDTGCASFDDDTEAPNPQCSDGVDNDGDGRTDHPADPACASRLDDSEEADCGEVAPAVAFCLSTGRQVLRQTLRAVSEDGAAHEVAGYVDAYRFVVAGFGVVVPCVTLVRDGAETNPCADAGGEFDGRHATLVEDEVREPVPQGGGEVATVAVCEAEIGLLVAGFGVDSAPAYALC